MFGRESNMKRKKSVLVTMIRPTPEVRNLLSEIEPHAEVRFLKDNEDIGENLKGVEVLYGSIPEKYFHSAESVRWVQTNSTGVDHMMYPAFQNSGIILTNTGASITTIVAEHALAMLFALARNLHIQRDFMLERKWEIKCGVEIGGLVLGIAGFGKIGRAIAERAKPSVKEIRALDLEAPEESPGISRNYGFDQLPEFLQVCNAIICSLPLTQLTKNMFGDREFATMPDNSYFINISRGGIVDEDALCRALRNKKLAGAGLDVTEREPYPSDGVLWSEPGLLLTPHSAGFCERLEERKIKQFVENFKLYISKGEIPGSIDKNKGW